MNIDKFIKVPIDEAIQPPVEAGVYELLTNSWWAVTEDGCILFKKSNTAAQCNKNKTITDMVIEHKNFPAAKSMFIPKVWVKFFHGSY